MKTMTAEEAGKLNGSEFKHLLKRYASGRLPPAVLQRPKKGFGAPLGKWFRGELKDLLAETLAPRRVAQQGIFRPEFVARLLEEHWGGRRDHRKQLFNLLTFTLWHDYVHPDRRAGIERSTASVQSL